MSYCCNSEVRRSGEAWVSNKIWQFGDIGRYCSWHQKSAIIAILYIRDAFQRHILGVIDVSKLLSVFMCRLSALLCLKWFCVIINCVTKISPPHQCQLKEFNSHTLFVHPIHLTLSGAIWKHTISKLLLICPSGKPQGLWFTRDKQRSINVFTYLLTYLHFHSKVPVPV